MTLFSCRFARLLRGSSHEFRHAVLAVLISLFVVHRSDAADFPSAGATAQSHNGMVVTASRPASEIGRSLLDQGGNAVDAAVGTAFALAVTWPEAGNLGGGGFMLIHGGSLRVPVMIDYREMAPAAATVEMFATGNASPYRLVGVPGTVRGLQRAHERFGRLAWSQVVTPAAELARNGFEVNEELARSLNRVVETSPDNQELRRVYGKNQGRDPWNPGDTLTLPDLAKTLSLIASEGPDSFYTGQTADLLVAEMEQGGGLITRGDLAAYQAKDRTPIHGFFRDYEIYASAPPSSGGIALIQMLNLVELFDLRQKGRWSATTLHLIVESMRRAYLDRARHLGDPDFTPIPTHLTSKDYAAKLAQGISLTHATPSADLGADLLMANEGTQTTHFSVIDQDGMAVSNTYTLEDSYGSRIVVKGAGFLLNDEMGDFNPRPGVTDSKGLIGTSPNQVAPGKRMLSSMTPVIVTKNGRPVLITGSPGGRTIINTVLCVVLNVLEFDMPIRDAVDAPRLHHQWMPDLVTLEPALHREHQTSLNQLRDWGHRINPLPVRQGDAHSIFISPDTGLRIGAADQRRQGWAAGQ